MGSQASLLREWDLLQERVVPPLLQVAPCRAPEAWTIGRPEDAVAVALAYHHARRDTSTAQIQVFLSGRAGQVPDLHFALADIRCVPSPRRDAAFVREDRHWTAAPHVMRRVILSRPAGMVDLVAIRDTGTCRSPTVRAAVRRLRRGGHLLFIDPPRDVSCSGRDFRPAEPTGRVWQRLTDSDGAGDPDGEGEGEEERHPVTLAARIEQGRLVRDHCNLARSLARRYANHGESIDDLEQVALLALVKAASRYTPDQGSTFATYATASVLGEIKRHFRDKTWMLRVPRSLQETYLAIKSAREDLGQKLGTSPTVQQIAAHLGVSDESVLAAMEAGDSYWPASLDAPRGDGEDTVTEIPVTDTGFEASLDRRQLRESLPKLNDREKLIIKRLYFDGWTQRRVADEIGVSQMQVSRLMGRILDKLRMSFEAG